MSDKTLILVPVPDRPGYVQPKHDADIAAFEHCNHNDNNRHFATEYNFRLYVWPVMRLHGYTGCRPKTSGEQGKVDCFAEIMKLSNDE